MIKAVVKKMISPKMKKWIWNWRVSLKWYILNNVISSFPSQTIRIAVLRAYGASIAKRTAVYGGNEYRNPRGLKVGTGSALGHRAILDARRGLTIGENVCFGTEVMIWTLHHDYNDIHFKVVGGPVVIENFVWLGSRCIILPNVTIGEGAVIAAGSIVTKNVAPYTVVGGIPAKVLTMRERNEYNYSPGHPRMHLV